MGVGSGFYKFLLFLHILTAIAGFGVPLMAPLFAREMRARRGKEGLAVFESFLTVISKFAMPIIYAVPVLGLLLIFTSDDAWKFSQGWVSMAMLAYIVMIGVIHAVQLPNLRAMNGLLTQMAGGPPPGGGAPPQAAELEARGKKAAAVGGVLNLLLVIILLLMVFKPGV